MQLRVAWSQGNGLLQRGDRVVEMFLGNLNIGAQFQRFECGLLPRPGAVQFGQRVVILLLLEQKMHEPRTGSGVVWYGGEVLAISISGFRFVLGIEASR